LNILLTTLNARFTHSALSLAYLYEASCNNKWTTALQEFTINDPINHIMSEIFRLHPSILCFSCYIWNIEKILELCTDYKKVDPQCRIVLGGPEVSYSPEEVLSKCPGVDYIISGEGEVTLPALLESIYSGNTLNQVEGVSYRFGDEIIANPARGLIADLDTIKSPYSGNLSYWDHKVIYYETSRGCPFNCSYCMSSTFKEVRIFQYPG